MANMQISDNTKSEAVEQFNSHKLLVELENCLAISNKAEYKLWPSTLNLGKYLLRIHIYRS